MKIVFFSLFTVSFASLSEIDARNAILFQIKVFNRKIKETTIARYFIQVILQWSNVEQNGKETSETNCYRNTEQRQLYQIRKQKRKFYNFIPDIIDTKFYKPKQIRRKNSSKNIYTF